jgi:hypothetical protein
MIDPSSRYRNIPTFTLRSGDGQTTSYLGRRFPADVPPQGMATYRVIAGDRPDLLAARTLNDPLAFWRLAEANLMVDPWSLTTTPGQVIRLPASVATFQVTP